MAFNHISTSPLGVYSSLKFLDCYKSYVYPYTMPPVMVSPDGNHIYPFQFVPTEEQYNYLKVAIDEGEGQVRLVHLNTRFEPDEVYDLGDCDECLVYTEYTTESGLTVRGIMFTSYSVGGINPKGYYIIKIEDGNELVELYTDVFSAGITRTELITIEYNRANDLIVGKSGAIFFGENSQFLALRTTIGRPEYIFDEVATERLGYSFVESQTSKKQYKFTFLATEPMCDFLRILPMCETLKVVDYSPSEDSLDDVRVFDDIVDWENEISWLDGGNVAQVTVTFTTNNIVNNIGGHSSNT